MKKIKDEHAERAKLQKLWASGKATKKQILRCMELDRKFEAILRKF